MALSFFFEMSKKSLLSVCSRWLKTSGDDCPNCNEKATRRDIRLHYVARLKAVDTAEKDRAVGDLEKFKCQLRTLELDHTTLKVTNAMQREEIDKVTINSSPNGLKSLISHTRHP